MRVAFSGGGKTYGVAADGTTGYVWKAWVDGDAVRLRREDTNDDRVEFTAPSITQIDLCFDQNMRPFFTYVSAGVAYYRYYDFDTDTYNAVSLRDSAIRFPRCVLDDPDPANAPKSDIILGYTRAGNLCYRIQRERFLKEYIVATDPKKTMLWRVGRTTDFRIGFQWR
uniref:Tail fiber protein n=1 Tax=Podoviridae sp. ctlpi2 TaxID=2826574 RepID=A0A8S5MLK9_9CAUD|nr:MAG TPA: Tail fiber protein [Podoviridae sp. ctlpi2]